MMGMSLQNSIALLASLVFLFSLNPQPSVCSSSSNATLPNNSPLMLCHPLQSHALLQFISTFIIVNDPSPYSYCHDRSYPKTESWKEGTDCCSSWEGVTCDDVTGHVIGLDLSCSQLEGTIHSNNTLFSHIAPHLQRLNLAGNYFYGSLDFDVFLSFNKLTSLNLSHNNISSSISASTHSNFSYSLPSFSELYLSDCNLKRLPTFIKALTNLTYLDVSNTQLQGPIPDWIYDVGKDTLLEAYLSENSLTGIIGHLNGWKSIQYIYFSSNLLQGSLPIIPTTVVHFYVSNNSLSGVISSSICNFTRLNYLDFDLSYNQFTGSIPQCLVNMSNLLRLDLGMNELHGVIPNTFATDCGLVSLVLKGNQLTGPTPPSLAHCGYFGNVGPQQ